MFTTEGLMRFTGAYTTATGLAFLFAPWIVETIYNPPAEVLGLAPTKFDVATQAFSLKASAIGRVIMAAGWLYGYRRGLVSSGALVLVSAQELLMGFLTYQAMQKEGML
ncbi:hypothetical protein DFJ74DRAFT_710880 [Hyaloraphidium curvatum]|nr:hypothetical protein DFJ74DRAFT_710880 [Hyaloraphidium curvatum]